VSAATIAVALGGSRSGGWWRCRCPVHQSAGPTLALRDGADNLVIKCHAGCAPVEILYELRRLGLLDGTYRPRNAQFKVDADDETKGARNRDFATTIWNAAEPAERSPQIARYFRSRDIILPPPRTLRWARSCRHPNGSTRSAMIALVHDCDGEQIGIHRTYLLADGTAKAPVDPARLSLGPIKGGAVRLAPVAETLMVGEGIETCLAAMQATAMPAWAALSTSGLTALFLPPVVREIIILVDNDVNGAGERAARSAAERWLAEGRRVRLAIPPVPGTDFNDVIAGRGYVRITEVRNAV
jgi:putative DNA primase/helicase